MEDYKKLYLKLFGAAEDAINLLIAAQRECEELYLAGEENDRHESTATSTEANGAAVQ